MAPVKLPIHPMRATLGAAKVRSPSSLGYFPSDAAEEMPFAAHASPWDPSAPRAGGQASSSLVPTAKGGGGASTASSALHGLRERMWSLGGNTREKTRSRLVWKATDSQREAMHIDDLKRIVADVSETGDGRWVLHRIRERPVNTNYVVAFKSLVVVHRVLQFSPPQLATEWGTPNPLLDGLVDHWTCQAKGGRLVASLVHGPQSSHCIQAVVDYARFLSAKTELMTERDAGRGRFNGSFNYSRALEEPSDLLQALALLLNLSEKLMPFALHVTAKDWQGFERLPHGRLYLGAIPVLLDEAWQLLCAVSVFVKDLLCQVHAAAKFGRTQPQHAAERIHWPPWLQLALHLLQAQPRFFRFHSSLCDFVALSHQLQCAGYMELAPPYNIPVVPQALLDLFADLGELLKGYGLESALLNSQTLQQQPVAKLPDGTQDQDKHPSQQHAATQEQQQPEHQKEQPQAANDAQSKAQPSDSTPKRTAGASTADSISNLSTAAESMTHTVEAGPTNAGNWCPSDRVLDALRTVDSLQRAPLLATNASADSDICRTGPDSSALDRFATDRRRPASRGYDLLESDSDMPATEQVDERAPLNASVKMASSMACTTGQPSRPLSRSASYSSVDAGSKVPSSTGVLSDSSAGSNWPSVFFPERQLAGASPVAAAPVGIWQDQTPPSWASAICKNRGDATPSISAPTGHATPLFASPLWQASHEAKATINSSKVAPPAAPALPLTSRSAAIQGSGQRPFAPPASMTSPPGSGLAQSPAALPVNPFDLPVSQLQRAATPPGGIGPSRIQPSVSREDSPQIFSVAGSPDNKQGQCCHKGKPEPAIAAKLTPPAPQPQPQTLVLADAPVTKGVVQSPDPQNPQAQTPKSPFANACLANPEPQCSRAQNVAGVQNKSPLAAQAVVAKPALPSQPSEPVGQFKSEWEVDHTELRLEELLGTGSTAEVYRASWHGTDVAVKKLRSSGQLSTEFRREILVLLRLRHPNLVLFMGACTQSPSALIISEFCAGGTVFALLHQQRKLALSWKQRLHFALDVAKGVNFLHRRQVVHRDLKSLNLLLANAVQTSDDVPQVKVSDFGLSRVFKADQVSACMTSGAGTYHWMAPEVLSGQSYDEKIDVYSYGICLFEFITRRIPYEGSGLEPVSIAVAVSKGRRPDMSCIPPDCPADLRFTMECCWAHRPSGRPGFDTILETLKLVKCPGA